MHHIDTNFQFSKLMKVTSSTQTDPITATLSENQLNTVDLLTAFFMKVYKKVIVVNKINECTVLETVTKGPSAFGINHSQRCSYLHFYATCHTLLVKNCITRFLNEYPKSEDLIKTWKSYLNISSVSFGPSLDCIAFILALLEASQDPQKIYKVGVVLSSKRWLKTVNTLSEVLREVRAPLKIKYVSEKATLKTILKPSKSKELLFLQSSNVVLMFQPFIQHDMKIFKNISELIKKLRSGALIFSITPSSSSSKMQRILEENPGTFLFGPVTVASDEFIVEIPGKSMKTVPSATFEFFVWVKDYDPLNYTGCNEKLPKPIIKSIEGALCALNLGEPPKIISFLRNDLKKVNFFYSFNDQIQEAGSLLKSIGTQTDLVSEAVLENKLNTNRLVTDFFMEVFKSELVKSNINESSIIFSNLPGLLSSSCGKLDDKARLAYMYLYATCHTLLMKECMVRFLKEYPEADKLLSKWRTNPNHCSLSLGPGLDYIAFNLAVLEVSHQTISTTQTRIIGTDNCWKSTVKVLSDVMRRVNTPLNLHFDANLIQPNLKCKKWTPKTVKYLRSASVVFMFKTLNLNEKEPMKYPPSFLKEMVSLMNTGNLIFFMDSASSSSMMKEVLGCFSGTFLHGPTLVSCDKLRLEVSEELMTSLMHRPAQSAEVEFFVWEKISNDLTPIKNIQIPDKASTSLQTLSKSTEKVEKKSDLKRSYLPLDASSSDSAFTPNDQIQLKSTAKTKPVVSKTIMMLKELMESTNDSDGANTVENSCELGAQKLIRSSNDGKTTSEHHSVHTELPQVSKPSSEMGPKKETLSDDQVGKINSLIARIDGLASSIEDDLGDPSRMSMSEGSVNVTEINLLTQKINNLITTLELNISNQHQCFGSRSHNCRCSCKMHVSPCQSNCDMDMTVKTSKPMLSFRHCSDCVSLSGKTAFKSNKRDIQHGRSSNCHIVPSQFLGHSVAASCVRQPSIVIPLENITPDMLSLILSCKK